MLRDDILIENNKYGYVTKQNNGAMTIVKFTHVQTAETRHSFHPPVNAGYKAIAMLCLMYKAFTLYPQAQKK